MLILTCPGQLQLLEEALRRSLPATLPVLGTVMTVARGNPAAHEVLVDSWPHFGVVLTRLRPEEQRDPGDFYANQLTVYYRDEGAWRALLGGTEAVGWSRAFQMHGKPGMAGGGGGWGTPPAQADSAAPGMQEGMYEAVREAADAKGLRLETYRYQALLSPQPPQPRGAAAPPPLPPRALPVGKGDAGSPRPPAPSLSALPHCRVPPGLRLAPVSPSHVPLLNATWSFGGNARSRRFLLGLVRALPSACLLGPRGRPVSWSLLDPLGCLSHGYTLPAWRGQGLSGVILGALGRGLHARGFPIYCGVLPHNTPSQRAVRSVGFLPQPGTFYTLVVTPQ
ncbi:glycine N-acyltransferase-like protein 3 [Morphnus guianensis]